MSIDQRFEEHGHDSGHGGHDSHSDGNILGPVLVGAGAAIGLVTGGIVGLGVGALTGYGAAKITGAYYR
ncbi:hypothetical protein HYU13_05260 [Candidatus Woesearchaeota archaeon]|nr:hypothetical protein [Candidatus Woesearchaeota archaeon]